MEQDSYYLRVGLFVSATIALFIFALGWFSVSQHKESYTTYAIYFSGSVDGLSLGSPVKLKGITVGNVKDISFLPDNDKIQVLANLMEKAPIRNDTQASMQLAGITGTSYISLYNTGNDPTPKVKQKGEEYATIPGTPSSLEKVFSTVPELVDEFKALGARGEKLLSDNNIAQFDHTLKSLDESSQALKSLLGSGDTRSAASAMQALNETLAEAKLTLREIRMLARTVREDPSILIRGTAHEGKEVP
jgi:phospholipid/cholesterol/gamma-HCH transport system substrate-binding protein